MNAWIHSLIMIAACDSGAVVAPPKLVPLPPPPAIDAAPAPPPERVMKIATWSSNPRPEVCIHANDRMIQYADLDAELAARFCIWFHLNKDGFPDVGCWRVDLATGTYHPESGVWFSSPQPGREDDGSTTAALADGTSAKLLGTQLQIGTAKLTVGKGAIVLARKADFIVVDRDGRVLLVDAAAKIIKTIMHGPCK